MRDFRDAGVGPEAAVEAWELRAAFNRSVAFARATHDPSVSFEAFAGVLYDHLAYLHGWHVEDLQQPVVART